MSRKTCSQCGLVNFESDENCKRCGSDLILKSLAEQSVRFLEMPEKKTSNGFLFSLIIALIIEGFLLFFLMAESGMRHSNNAPTSTSEIIIYLFHLPTIILSWAIGVMFAPFVPITQIIFWTFLIQKIKKKLE